MESTFITGKWKLRGLFNKESMAFHWLNPHQKRKGIFLLPVECCYCCNLIYQSYEAFYWDPHGITQDHCCSDSCSSSGRILSCSEHHWPSQHPREVFSSGVHPTFEKPVLTGYVASSRSYNRKWQSLDSNTGTFPNEAHQLPFLFLIKFFKTVENAHNINLPSGRFLIVQISIINSLHITVQPISRTLFILY